MSTAEPTVEASGPPEKGMLAAIERLGNKVPPPALMFGYLILLIIALSWGLALAGVSITEQIAVPVEQGAPQYDYYEDTTQPGMIAPEGPHQADWTIVEETIPIKSLLSTEGVRFIFSSFVNNFAGFGVVALVVQLFVAGVIRLAGLFFVSRYLPRLTFRLGEVTRLARLASG